MPNVVLIHTDDTGRYIGPYGHAIETPALDRLAAAGLTFRHAYCAGPTCSPSRSAVMSGLSPHVNGMIGLAHRGFSMDDYGRHLASVLSAAGVETVLAGQQHEASVPDRSDRSAARDVLGYDRELAGDPDAIGELPIEHDRTRRDLANADAVASYLRERDDEEPFFLSLGLYNTHQPMPLDQKLVDPAHVSPPDPLPDVPPVREEMAAYHVLARYVDDCVGTVLDALAATGQLDETVVAFTTDHGIPFPFMKCTLRDDGMGISLLARFPDGRRAGEATDALVSNLDLYPTILESLDVAVPTPCEGRSLLPLTLGEVDAVRDAVFSEVTYHAAYEPKRCVRTERYKYVRRFEESFRGRVGPNTDAGPSKSFLLDHGFLDRSPPSEALYDLYHDPNERENRIDDPAVADVRDRLRDRLEEWMRRTDDPLLDGPVPKPEGAWADQQEAVHPGEGEAEPADAR